MKIFAFARRLGPAALDSDASTDQALTVCDLQPLGDAVLYTFGFQ